MSRFRLSLLCALTVSSLLDFTAVAADAPPLEIGSRRELFADRYLVESFRGTRLVAHEPRDEGIAFSFDAPWEGPFAGYVTVIHDGPRYRAYYRGKAVAKGDGDGGEVTCVAESADGLAWTKPKLGLIDIAGSRENNVVLSERPFAHNFSPFLDANPAAPAAQLYKALAGTMETGLVAFTSPDGLRWEKLQAAPVIPKASVAFPYMFDSQNVAFWSVSEGRYVSFFRVFSDKIRRICRAESDDFLHWRNVTLMDYRGADGSAAPIEHLYTSQTHPYFRAPQLYVALAARFMPGRQVLTEDQAKEIHVHPQYFKDTSDAVFLTTRGGGTYDRTFMSAFIRPGIGAQNWVSRSTYPALNVVQTGPTQMSAYVNEAYAQPAAHLHRYSLRLDGFSSLRAPYEGGEMVTKPLLVKGTRLYLNFSTSAAGGIRVEIQDPSGAPIPGYALSDSTELIGNEIERPVRWKATGDDVAALSGRPLRLRFVLKDADIFSLQFK